MQNVVFRPEPQASALVRRSLESALASLPAARALGATLAERAGMRLEDLVDVVALEATDELRRALTTAGFRALAPARTGTELYAHEGALFPLFELSPEGKRRLFVRVESLVDFLEASNGSTPLELEGEAGALVRRALVSRTDDGELWVVERWGGRRLVTSDSAVREGPGLSAMARHLDVFRLRERPLEDPERGFEAAQKAIAAARQECGDAVACELFFEAERRYYARRNRAARLLKAGQDALGFGFANHDHHTYRSSRRSFRSLVASLEALGLVCRERFYAGKEAGWGAQVMEHEETGICVFADVDLTPEEVTGDFAHQGLAPRERLGTVGLWCELHGEAFLSAGMHHLECQFDFAAASRKLTEQGVSVMPRFTDFPHLQQAFTQGEIWRVPRERLTRLERVGLLTAEQVERIANEGALGSHFEILERNLGYKGFNQDGINKIILATDPRGAEAATSHG